MRSRCAALFIAPLLSALLPTVVAGAAPAGADPGSPAPAAARGAQAGADEWTKISTGTVGAAGRSSLHRTPDGVLHAVYPKVNGRGQQTLGHAAIGASGSLVGQEDVLRPGWRHLDETPTLVGDGDGLRAVFAGVRADSGFWSDGRMYTATASEDGSDWTLPAEAVGRSHSAYRSPSTAAVALADGTPVAAYARGSRIVWHVGTGDEPDRSFTVDGCCARSLGMVDNGGDVWIGWHQDGRTARTTGTFVKQILPAVGPTMKAPGSSEGVRSVSTGRVALAVQVKSEDDGGPRTRLAYCTGYPTCEHIVLADVSSRGVSPDKEVPGTRGATRIAISPGPGDLAGRIWFAWSDRDGRVRAIRTGGDGFTGISVLGRPKGAEAARDLSVDGTGGVADVVVNTGRAFWHAQAAPALKVKARPSTWRHGTRQTVVFVVRDGDGRVREATVKVGPRSCDTGAKGTCSITFPRTVEPGVLVARATLRGHDVGTVRLKVT